MRPRLIRALTLALALAWGASPAYAAGTQETIVFVRHGEKPAKGLGQIDCQGFNRAMALTSVLTKRYGTPQYIFAPNPGQQVKDSGTDYNYIRPLATIEPTAIRLGMPVDTRFGFLQISGLEQALLAPSYRQALVFVAWEHTMLVKTVRALVARGGGNPAEVPDWNASDFDSIYVLRITRDGGTMRASFAHEREGLTNLSATCP
jgi:hypothetical protein